MTSTDHFLPTYSGPNRLGVLHRRAHHVVQGEAVLVDPELVGQQLQVVPLGQPLAEERPDGRPALEAAAGHVVEDRVGGHEGLRRVDIPELHPANSCLAISMRFSWSGMARR